MQGHLLNFEERVPTRGRRQAKACRSAVDFKLHLGANVFDGLLNRNGEDLRTDCSRNLGHHNEDESREVEVEEEEEKATRVHLWRKQHEERRRPLFPRVDQVSRLQRDCFSSAFWQRGGGGCDW